MDDITHQTDVVPAQKQPYGMLRRIVAFPLTLLVIEIFAIGALATGYTQAAHQVIAKSNGPAYFAGAVGLAVLLVLLWKALQRWLERREDREFALPGAGSELGLGLLTGFLLFSAMTGIVALLGGFEVLGLRGQGALWTMLAMAVTSGTFEEILFRGVLLRHLEALIGTWGALAITSLLFGAAHLSNPGATLFAAFAIAMEAGVLLGAAYLLTRRLWLAVGIHAAWNFTQGWVFSVPVSGGESPLGLLITRRVGPEWLTGGDFGLEASVVAMVVATGAGLAMLVLAAHRGAIVAPLWRRQP
ncbi:MAG: CPBP family intramembrane metalloprotease [Pseudomonadota bacterium]|nr:CPBP family intramembrane metalloprotease [Pseudomonadota bacterium]